MDNTPSLELEYTNPTLFTQITPTDADGIKTLQTPHVVMQDEDSGSHPPTVQQLQYFCSCTHLIAQSVLIQPMANRQHYALANTIIQHTECTQTFDVFLPHICNAIIDDNTGKTIRILTMNKT